MITEHWDWLEPGDSTTEAPKITNGRATNIALPGIPAPGMTNNQTTNVPMTELAEARRRLDHLMGSLPQHVSRSILPDLWLIVTAYLLPATLPRLFWSLLSV